MWKIFKKSSGYICCILVGVLIGPAISRAANDKPIIPLDEIGEFTEVFHLIQQYYVDSYDSKELITKAIRGMVSQLDQYSNYFDEEQFASFRNSLAGQFGGVGIYVGESSDGWVEVVSPIDDTPASRAGINNIELIVKIDGVSTRNIGIESAVAKMRGEPGTVVQLELLNRYNGERRTVELVREVITTPSVRGSLIDQEYGYIRISQFQPDATIDGMVDVLNELYKDSNGKLRGLILDLRNNPGGDLFASIGVASTLLPEGKVVVSDIGRVAESTKIFKVDKNLKFRLLNQSLFEQIPVIVLVNYGSASASEIVSGALQDHGRALVVGYRTYGKASVQSVVELRSRKAKTALSITTARYFTPKDISIQDVGIQPDITFANDENVIKDSSLHSSEIIMQDLKTAADGAMAVHQRLVEDEQAIQSAEQERKENGQVFLPPRSDGAYVRAYAVLQALVNQSDNSDN